MRGTRGSGPAPLGQRSSTAPLPTHPTPAPPLGGKELSRRGRGVRVPGNRQKGRSVAGVLGKGDYAGPPRTPRWEPGPGTPLSARAPPPPSSARRGQGTEAQARRREPCAHSLPTCLGRKGADSGDLRQDRPRPHMSVAREAWRLAPA